MKNIYIVSWYHECKRVHLHSNGNARLALNPKATIRKLPVKFNNPIKSAYQGSVTSFKTVSDGNIHKYLPESTCLSNNAIRKKFEMLSSVIYYKKRHCPFVRNIR